MHAKLTLIVLAAVIGTGCVSKQRVEFTPTSVELDWDVLAGGQPVTVSQDYRLIVSERTQGMFPSSLAVARLSADEDPTATEAAVVLDMEPEVDFLSWNSVFDDFRSISEVFPMNIMAMDGAEVTVNTLLNASYSLRAGMLLVYSESRKSIHEAQVKGVLYSVPARRMLAAIHADAYIEDPVDLDDSRCAGSPSADMRDPRLVCVGQFEAKMRDCLLALMQNDDPVKATAPDGWIPDREIEPLIWPPSEDLFRRRW